jgi:hypothetical protein
LVTISIANSGDPYLDSWMDLASTRTQATNTNILFLDACCDNPLARNLARAMGTRSAEVGRGLAEVKSGVGTLISFSTQPGNVALDWTDRNSPFAGALVKQLTSSTDDLSAILISVRNDVMRETQRKQVPWEHSALTGRFYFKVPAPVAPAVTPAPPSIPVAVATPPPKAPELPVKSERPTTPEDEAAWREAQKGDRPEAYGKYMREHPYGHYTGDARRAVVDLEDWAVAEKVNSRTRYQAYLDAYPDGRRTAQARDRVAAFDQEAEGKACQTYAQDTAKQVEENQRNECVLAGEDWSPNQDVQETLTIWVDQPPIPKRLGGIRTRCVLARRCLGATTATTIVNARNPVGRLRTFDFLQPLEQ